jgi:DnaJ-class molecular chaperone
MDHYSILGVPKTATPEEIKQAYKKKVKEHHPDRGGDEEHFKRINEAYEILSNSDKRTVYDNPNPGFNFTSQDFGQGFNPFANSPFGDVFGQQFGFNRTPRNRDITLAASLDLADVITGKSLIMQYTLNSSKLETVTVDVPAGAKHGDTIRYQGLGDDGHGRYPRGDLLVKIKVNKKKDWERDGNNLITRRTINVFDLMLGCAILVITLDGKTVNLKIPKGTRSGQIFSINGYGVPDLNTKQRGNLYVEIQAEIPKLDDEAILKEIETLRNKLYTK